MTLLQKHPTPKQGFKDNSGSGWLQRQAFRFWRNLARNWKGEVEDCDFFDLFAGGRVSREAAIRILRSHFDTETLLDAEALVIPREPGDGEPPKYRLPRGGIPRALQSIWNEERLRDACREMLCEWVVMLLDRETPARRRDPTERRVTEVARTLDLNGTERELLVYALVRELTVFDDFPETVQNRTLYLAMAADCPTSDVEEALAPTGTLRRHGILDDDGDIARGPFRSYLLGGADGSVLEGNFYRKRGTEGALPWEYFGPLAKEHGAILKRLLRAASAGRSGANILFHGAPGTGKTSFALTLARELGLTPYEIRQGDKDGECVSAQSRLTGIFICSSRVPRRGSLMLVDEADQLLETRFRDFFGGFTGGGTKKGAVNSLMDTVRVPAIWITNLPPEALDESVRRRFDYSVGFPKLSESQRRAVWRNTVAKLKLERYAGEEQIAEWARKYPTSAGGIASVLGNVRRMRPRKGEAAALVERLMRPHCALMGLPSDGKGNGISRDYSLEGLNIRGDIALGRVVEAVRNFRDTLEDADTSDPDRPRMNLLLWGPPGTGKTEFVKYLGSQLGVPVNVRMGSDLLSMWVGGTERNIREAFEQAEREEAILFLDELDGLVQDRTGAQQQWEVTQVNELLHRMENFRGVMVGATNFMDNLDRAILRRFTFKLQFDCLTDEGKRLFFERMFHAPLSDGEAARLARIPNLAPGDFRTVRQALHYLGGTVDNAVRLGELEKESALKKDGAKGRIGF
jgi:AAA+ superfamily predicted ATPase